jgi:hypothetical protein
MLYNDIVMGDRATRDMPKTKDAPVDKSSVIQQEVRRLFKHGQSNLSLKDMAKLREKYTDAKLVDEIYNEFVKQYNDIVKQAKKFADIVVEKYGTSRYPMHRIVEKALKYKEKLKMSDAAFAEFQRLYEKRLSGEQIDLYTYRTLLAKTFNEDLPAVHEGLSISDNDYKHLQEVLRLYKESEPLYHQMMLQSLSYEDCAPQAFTGTYDRNKHNPANHVHPLLAALFLIKCPFLDERMLFANYGYIIKCRHDKRNIDTRPNYELYYDAVRDPVDTVCSIESPMADLLNRFRLQIKIWESVGALRRGQYYNESFPGFVQMIDNCRINIYDMPELMYIKDEGTMLRRLFAAFALRPTIVTTTPMYGIVSDNPYDRMKMLPVLKQVSMITVRFPPTVDALPVNLNDALDQSHWYIENNTLVPKSQSILYSRDILVFYVNRRYQSIQPARFLQPYNFTALPLTTSGFEELNERPVQFETSFNIRDDRYNLRSVVCLEKYTYSVNQQSINMITGCSTVIVKQRNVLDALMTDRYLLYNPADAAIIERKASGHLETMSPIEFIDAEIGPNVPESERMETFYNKVSRTGTIFVYLKENRNPI